MRCTTRADLRELFSKKDEDKLLNIWYQAVAYKLKNVIQYTKPKKQY